MELHTIPDRILKDLKFTGTLPGPLFPGCPNSLRIPIGGKEEIYLADHRMPSGSYVENGVQKALSVLHALREPPDLLQIFCDPLEALEDLPRLRLPAPDLSDSTGLFWKLSGPAEILIPLLREIIRSELSPAGMEWLCGTVYLANSRDGILFHLYDDRGADLAFRDPAALRSFRENFSECR